MERHLTRPADTPDLRHRLNGANLVIGIHDGDEDGLIGDGPLYIFGIDAPIAINGQIGGLEAETLQVLAGVEYRVMLNGRGNDMIALLLRRLRHTLDRQVVALRAATREGNLRWTAIEYFGHLLARGINRLHGMPPQRIDTAGIAIFCCQVRQHRLQYARIKRGSGRMVKVDDMV